MSLGTWEILGGGRLYCYLMDIAGVSMSPCTVPVANIYSFTLGTPQLLCFNLLSYALAGWFT